MITTFDKILIACAVTIYFCYGEYKSSDTITADTAPLVTNDSSLVHDNQTTDSSALNKAEPDLLIKSKGDTVILLVDDLTRLLSTVKEKVHHSRVQGFGGAGGFSHRLMAMDMGPVVDLIQGSTQRMSIHFPKLHDGYEVLPMSGGLGYGGIGNGVRIGGGGFGGLKLYRSEPFSDSGSTSISQITLRVNLGFGGLMIEKVVVNQNWNLYTGSLLAFGGIEVSSKKHPYGKGSAFLTDENDFEDGNKFNAALMGLELHSGGTYTFVPWMHVGADISSLFFFSSNGFENSFGGGFFGAVPSLGIRVVFGNLG